jgi:exodeoxyribonuclease-3
MIHLSTVRIITFNANGIRSAARKGFFTWLAQQDADVVCIQETKAQLHQLDERKYFPPGYHCYYHDAEKKGYSGVALYTRQPPQQVHYGLGWQDFDREGRWLEIRFDTLCVVSLYLPSGSSGDVRQQFKFDLMERLLPHLQALRDSGRDYVICGDWNIAHKAIDIKNWRGNLKNSGFLPEERAWLERLFTVEQFIDTFRVIDPRPERYTWWSNRGQARANNVGWRIDYQIATPGIGARVQAVDIYTNERFSDHAPLIMDYAGSLTDSHSR